MPVHGDDLHLDTVVGTPVSERLAASVPGAFEVELERSGTQLTRLQVR